MILQVSYDLVEKFNNNLMNILALNFIREEQEPVAKTKKMPEKKMSKTKKRQVKRLRKLKKKTDSNVMQIDSEAKKN